MLFSSPGMLKRIEHAVLNCYDLQQRQRPHPLAIHGPLVVSLKSRSC